MTKLRSEIKSKARKKKAPRVKKPRTPKKPIAREKRLALAFLSLVVATFCLMALITVLTVNLSLKASVKDRIFTLETMPGDAAVDCIIVLGCGVKADGTPSDMLYDRIKTACLLYQAGVSDTILFSGDHGREGYDEVGTMKRVAHEEFGIPLEDIFLDHAGFSTYETMARASHVFGVRSAVVVTQEYHLYRALYLAEAYDIEAHGVSASLRGYQGQTMRDLREVAARCKDALTALVKPDFVGGEPIDIHGDGQVTHD
ncbi:MAG: YdcF family protein [Clostridia bacterium]|nr:YdcF family protein [Clostridia bacterium]